MPKFLLVLLLAGCSPCQEITLPSAERAWLGPYRAGTTITFRSSQGHSNTFTVLPAKEWHENTKCNRLEAGPYQPIFSQIFLRPATPYDEKNRDFVLSIRKTNPDRPGLLTYGMGGLAGTTSAEAGQPSAQLVQQACTLATSGKVYPQAFVFRHGQNSSNYGNGRVQAFYWDKADGLIRYELSGGEVFDLVLP